MKKKKNINKKKVFGICFILLAIFIFELLLYTWCRVQSTEAGYKIAEEIENHRRLVTIQNSLKIELAQLRSPERIAKIAKKQLGLSMPKPDQMFIIP